ncbi:MAG: apolipoprotein N-acyltransferase [Candidatus Omnitrophica bacterium]|nr:apolipoprotein N-acyltransferase [Candidatus Omnitrophota bacterium]
MLANTFVALISGLLTSVSFNFSCLSFFIWFGLFPLFTLLYRTKNAPIYFFIAGFIQYLTTIFWISFVSKLGFILLSLYLAIYWFIFGHLSLYFIRSKYAIFVLPALWVILEFIKENILGGFGWVNFAYSQYKNLFLIQISDILGAKSISFLIVMVNFLIFFSLHNKKIVLKEFLYTIFILIIVIIYSLFRLKTLDSSFTVKLTVIQPNIHQEIKWDVNSQDFIIERLKELGNRAGENTLLLYPEASWPKVIDMRGRYQIEEISDNLNRDALIGVVIDEEGCFYNSAILIDKEGNIKGLYRKIKLVPFGEYVPFRKLLGFIDVLNTLGDISRGKEVYIFNYKDRKFGTIICFEDTFPILVSTFSKRSDFLVNITNDAWFRGEPEASQHFSIMTFRAIENRISIVRSANTGISGYVDFLGRASKLNVNGKEVFTEGLSSFELPLNSKRSIYNRLGEFFVGICGLIVLGASMGNKIGGKYGVKVGDSKN